MAIRISHPVHVHHLEKTNCQKPYTCDGCKEQGFGLTYRCEQCHFDLHEDCVFTNRTISHDFFKKATFEFLCQKPIGSTRYCSGCGKGIHGFQYHCKEKDWYLHPCCAKLEGEFSIGDKKFQLRKKVSSKCKWCKEKKLKDTFSGTRGWAYVSKCKKYQFHVYCVTEMVHQAWKDNNCLGSEQNLKSLLVQVNHRNRNGSGGNKIVKITKVLVITARILHGDPTALFSLFSSVFGN